MTGTSGVFRLDDVPPDDRFSIGVSPAHGPRGGVAPVHKARSHNGRFTAMLDGYLINARSLKAKLGGSKMESDVEIALALFEREGVQSFNTLDGAFAIAVYDSKEQTLILARDRVGQMPLYYHQDGNRLLFSSSLEGCRPGIFGQVGDVARCSRGIPSTHLHSRTNDYPRGRLKSSGRVVHTGRIPLGWASPRPTGTSTTATPTKSMI
ncbi:MAG: hypothetical protein V9G13_10910 [Marmoricola sp.]